MNRPRVSTARSSAELSLRMPAGLSPKGFSRVCTTSLLAGLLYVLLGMPFAFAQAPSGPLATFPDDQQQPPEFAPDDVRSLQDLQTELHCESAEKRAIAAFRLYEDGSREALDLLRDALASQKLEVIRSVLAVTADRRESALLPELLNCLSACEGSLVEDIHGVLRELPGEELLEALQARLQEEGLAEEARVRLVFALGFSRLREAVPVLLEALAASGSEGVTGAAFSALEELVGRSFDTAEEAQAWWEHNRELPREEWLQQANESLRDRLREAERLVQQLREQLAELDRKRFCAQLAAEKNSARRIELAREALEGPYEDTRVYAAEWLGDLDEETAGAPVDSLLLVQLQNDPSVKVRRALIASLGKRKVKAAVPQLLECLREADEQSESLRPFLIRALGDLGDAQAVEPLLAFLQDSDKDLQFVTIESLGKIRASEATKPLIPLLRSEERELRLVTLEALGRIGDEDCVRAVKKTLATESDPQVRQLAVETLGRTGTIQTTASQLGAALADPDAGVAAAAEGALLSLIEQNLSGIEQALEAAEFVAERFAEMEAFIRRADVFESILRKMETTVNGNGDPATRERYARLQLALGELRSACEQFELALEAYERARPVLPEDRALSRRMLTCYLETRAFARARPLLEGLLASAPDEDERRQLQEQLWECRFRTGDYQAVLEEVTTLLQQEGLPDDYRARLEALRARCQQALQKEEQERRAARKQVLRALEAMRDPEQDEDYARGREKLVSELQKKAVPALLEVLQQGPEEDWPAAVDCLSELTGLPFPDALSNPPDSLQPPLEAWKEWWSTNR